jgi:hypothetical protein
LAAGADPAARDAEGRTPAAVARPRLPTTPLDGEALAAYQGLYRGAEAGFRVWLEDGRLWLREFAPDELLPVGPDRFVCRREPWQVVFRRGADGAVAHIDVAFLRRTVTAHRHETAVYVGSARCRTCHDDGHTGPWLTWLASRHAAAYWRLATDWAAHLAAIRPQYADIADPPRDARCLLCHVSGAQDPSALHAADWRAGEGVGCEACHGPGSLYANEDVMTARAAFLAAGGRLPDEDDCRACHRRADAFDFAAAWRRIAHGTASTGG